MNIKVGIAIVVFNTLMACGGGGSDSEGASSSQPTDSEPKAVFSLADINTGHYGKLYNAKGEELALTQDNIKSLQQTLIDDLYATIGSDNQNYYAQIVKDFESYQFENEIENVLFNNAYIGALLETTDTKIADNYRDTYRLIRHHSYQLFPLEDQSKWQAIWDFLSSRYLLDYLGLFFPNDYDDYMQDCADNGVPIPPDWKSDEWEYQGNLSVDFLTSGTTEVWAYEDPDVEGTCIALPRKTGNQIGLLGIICQGDETGKACFWDNVSAETGARLSGGDDLSFKISEIQNGNSLDENCTQCHRGKNVFLIHPGTAIDVSGDYDINPQVRYQPVSTQAAWSNPEAHTEMGGGACASCHEIGGLSAGYCRILRNAASETMPSQANPAGWPSTMAAYQAHISALIADCP